MSIKKDDEGKCPLIPDIAGMTRIVRERVMKLVEYKPILETIESHFKTDDRKDFNVEAVLSHIRALRAVAGKDKVRGLSADNLDQMDKLICDIIVELADKELLHKTTPYHQVASWIDGISRHLPIDIFTTNYDLLIEQAIEDQQVPYFDGFAGGRKPYFDIRSVEEDKLPPRWVRLWKLHGSVNWYEDSANRRVYRGSSNEEGDKRVIFPSYQKYEESRRLPYLAMIDRLRAFLKESTATLILIGYSFRDEHFNEAIIQGLQSTQNAIAFALLFDNLDEYPDAIALAGNRPNLSLLAKNGAVINTRKACWISKNKEAIENEPNWIKWIPDESVAESETMRAEFLLGDFSVFGDFLRQIVGNTHDPSGEQNAQ